MKAQITEITPLIGLGDVQFGMTLDEVQALIGEPDEKEELDFSEDGGDLVEIWHYDELEISLAFEDYDGMVLSSISITGGDFELMGNKLMGKTKDKVVKILEGLDLGEVVEDIEASAEIPGHNMVAIPDYFMNFWFEDGMLVEIQWEPEIEEDGDEDGEE